MTTNSNDSYRIYHYLVRGGENDGYVYSDLIFQNGKPVIVLQDGKDESTARFVPIDPQYLHKIVPPWPLADYMYEFHIVDPQPTS